MFLWEKICTGGCSSSLEDIQYICVLICFEYIAPYFIILKQTI